MYGDLVPVARLSSQKAAFFMPDRYDKNPQLKLEVLSMPVWRYRLDFVFIRDSFYLQRRGIAREFVAY